MMEKYKNILFGLMVVVTVLTVTSCQDDEFPTVAITNVNVDAAYPGDEVAFTGQGFENIQFVFVGTIQTAFTLDGGMVTFTIPENATVGMNTITLAMPDDQRVKYDFEVLLRPTPKVEAYDAFVPVGENMTIIGSSFNSEYNPSVTIGGVEASIVSNTATELVVTVPNGIDDSQPLEVDITTIHGTTTIPTTFYAKEDLLANSQLEEGEGNSFTDWEVLNGGDNVVSVAEGYGGTRSMYVTPAGGNPWDVQVASTAVPLTFGETYTVVFWAKADASPGAGMRISVSQYNAYGAGSDYFYSHGNDEVGYELSTNWEQYTATFEVTQDLPDHRIVLDMGKNSGAFMIDHIGLVQGTLGSGAAPELLTNSSFEDDLTGWTALNGTFETTTDEAYCGSASLTATGAGGNPWDVQLASDPMVLEVGTDYEIGFWAKAAGSDGVFRLSMSQYASGQSDDFFYSPDIDIPEDWTYFSFITTAQATSTGDQRLLFDVGASTQTFFIDAVSVKEYSAPASLYANGGFEDDMDAWTALNGTFEISTDEAYEGTNSITATGVGGNPWDVQLATDPVVLTAGTQYKLSFWVKAAGPDGVMRASVSQYASGQSDDFFYSPDVTVTEDWSYQSFVFTAAATSTGNHRFVFDFGSTTQTFFMDNVIVQEYDLECE